MPNRFCGGARALPLVVGVAAAAVLPVRSTLAQTAAKPAPKPAAPGKPLGQVQVAPSPGLVLFNKALAATKAKRYAEAERLYRQILKFDPSAAAVWANIGLLQANRGRFAEAEKSLSRAVQYAPQAMDFRAQLASLQYRLGRYADADKNAQAVLKKEPRNVLALATRSDVLMEQRRYREAVPVLQRLRAVSPRIDDRTEINLILALNGSGKMSQALVIARKRIQRVPTAPSYLILGDTLRLGGDLDGARTAYAQAQKLDPKNPGAATGLSVVAALSGDRQNALRLLEQQLERSPDDPRLHFQRGYLLYTMPDTSAARAQERGRRLAQAEQSFYQAATLDPKNSLYLSYAGTAGLAQGATRFRDAENLFRGALNLEPRNTMARVGLAYLAIQQNKPQEALAQYRAVLQYAPKDLEARRGIAGVLYSMGKKDQAYKEMRTIALQNPQDTRTLAELGSWLVDDKRTAEAQAIYEQILMRDPKDEGAYLALARFAEQAKLPEQARKRYRDALTHVPTSVNAALLLGQSLVADKKTDEAMEVYRSLLKANPDSSSVRWELAVLLNQAGRDDEALKEMRQIRLSDSDPNRVQYLLGPARVYLKAQKYPEAIAALRTLAQENPSADEIRYVLAEALRRGGQSAEAEQMLIALRDRTPTREGEARPARPALLLGDLYETSDRLDEAAGAYEEALRRDATNLTAAFGLHRVRVRQNKPEAASEFIEQLALADPKEPLLTAVGSLRQLHVENKTLPRYTEFTARLLAKYPQEWTALYLRARGITDEVAGAVTPAARQEAVGLYRQILAKDKRNIEAQEQLGAQYEALGQKTDAIAAYREVLQWRPQDPVAQEALKRLGDQPDKASSEPPASKGQPLTQAPAGAATKP